MTYISKTPEPPYYAAIFTSERTEGDKGYSNMADKMVELASNQPEFLGVESARDSELGITVSYWDSLDAISQWKNNAAHQIAQQRVKSESYKGFGLRVTKVERQYLFEL